MSIIIPTLLWLAATQAFTLTTCSVLGGDKVDIMKSLLFQRPLTHLGHKLEFKKAHLIKVSAKISYADKVTITLIE